MENGKIRTLITRTCGGWDVTNSTQGCTLRSGCPCLASATSPSVTMWAPAGARARGTAGHQSYHSRLDLNDPYGWPDSTMADMLENEIYLGNTTPSIVGTALVPTRTSGKWSIPGKRGSCWRIPILPEGQSTTKDERGKKKSPADTAEAISPGGSDIYKSTPVRGHQSCAYVIE